LRTFDGGVKVLVLPILIVQRRNPRHEDPCRPPRYPWRHVKDEHLKDAAQDGGVKTLILPFVIFQWQNPRPTHECRLQHMALSDTRRTGT